MRYWLRLLQHSQLCRHILSSSPYCILKISIITILYFQHSCSHELNQYLQLFYHICCYHFLVRTNNDLFSIVDSNEKWFVWWSFLEHIYWISIPWGFHVMFIVHQCCCYFFPEIGVLFSPRLKWLVVWWWLENPCLSGRFDELYIFEEIVDFLIYKAWTLH